MYGQGISKGGEIIDRGVENNVIQKSGSWFSYGETRLGQGRDSVKQLLLDNPEMMDEMESKIFAIINGDVVEEEAEQAAAK
jgi:recombination protein RecA